MRAFATLLRRELHARRALLVASLAMGCFVAVFPFLTGSRGTRAEELRGAAAVVVALIWSTLLALGLGATCLARDLGERRLASDFRLPASATGIWAARLLGAWTTVLLAGSCVLALPALFGCDFEGASAGFDFLAQPPAWDVGLTWTRGWLLLYVPAALGALLLLANIAGLTFFGNRSWSALDLASLLLLALAMTLMRSGYRYWGDADAEDVAQLGLLLAAVLGLMAATWWQVSEGRTESGRAHSRASSALAIAVLVSAGLCALAYRRHVHPSLDALSSPGEGRVLSEELAALSLRSPGRPPLFRFLVDRKSGEFLRLGPYPWPVARESRHASSAPGFALGAMPSASTDGHRIVWLERERTGLLDFACRVFMLTGPGRPLQAEATPVLWSRPPASWSLSPDGSRIATRWPESHQESPTTRIVIENLESGGTELALQVPDCDLFGPIAFLEEDRLRVTCGRGEVPEDGRWPYFDRRDIQIPSGTQVRSTGYFEEPWLSPFVHGPVHEFRAPGWHLRVHRTGPFGRWDGWELVSERTEQPIRLIPEWRDDSAGPWPTDGMALPDGRFLLVIEQRSRSKYTKVDGKLHWERTTPGWVEVRSLSRSGESLRVIRIAQPFTRILAVEADGRAAILVGNSRRWEEHGGLSPFVARLDLNSGELRPLDRGSMNMPSIPSSRPGIATRERDGNWAIENPRGTVTRLFSEEHGPPPASWRLPSTGKVETPLRRR